MRRAAGVLLDLLFPRKCVFCRKLLAPEEDGLCARCAAQLPYTEGERALQHGEFWRLCASPFYYEGAVRESVHRFKFGGCRGYAGPYAAFMADCARAHFKDGFDLVTWAPVGAKRLRQRGYDQGALLAAAVGARMGIPVRATLRKTAENEPQSTRGTAEARRANVLGVYAFRPDAGAEGLRVLLVDDVVTTGATLSECARVLRTGGASSVCCLTLARRKA